MEKFVSSWSDGKTLPENYIFPADQRPGELVVPRSDHTIPVIDLGKADGHDHASSQILQACQELGAFQVINHGVSRRLMDDARHMFKEFFKLPAEDKSTFITSDPDSKFKMYTSTVNYDEEKIHLWRDTFQQKCSPLEECILQWPTKPAEYREIIQEYTIKVNELGLRILELICEGLGIEEGYFANEQSQHIELIVNHYPICPDPTLTLGVGKHSDRSLITILMQGTVPGLQISKEDEWIDVDPIPDAFVVHVGNIMQIASNGKLKNGDHRALTNAVEVRESAALFLMPTRDCFIEPAKAFVSADSPPLYRGFRYYEYLAASNTARRLKDADLLLKPFRI